MIVSTEEALDSPENDRSFLGNNLSFLYRTVRFTQNTTIFFKGWHNFKEIVTNIFLIKRCPSGPLYKCPVAYFCPKSRLFIYYPSNLLRNMCSFENWGIFNNYSPKWRWLVVDIYMYEAAKR